MEDLASLLILKKSFVLYKVVEREWVETRTYLLQKIPQDDDVQNNPEHDDFKQRYKAFLEKHRSDLEENKLSVQVCKNGLKRRRGQWSIELFQSKRCAIQLAAERSGRKAGSSKGKWRDDKEKGYQEQ